MAELSAGMQQASPPPPRPAPEGPPFRHTTASDYAPLAGRAPPRGAGLRVTPALVMLLAAAYALAWGLGLAWSRHAPTLDSAEQLVWSYALEPGYWKHPPLPTWILHALVQAFGPSVTLTFLATQAGVAVALALLWALGCEFMSPRRSLAAAALTSLVVYHGCGADSFNHDTVLLPFQAATMLFFLRAARRGRWLDWLLAGLFAGLALLTKYVAVFVLAPLLLYFVLDRSLHQPRRWAGLALAAAVALATVAPHLLWLQSHGYPTLAYARSVLHAPTDAVAHLGGLIDFSAQQYWRVLPLLLALVWLLRPGQPRTEAVKPLRREDRLFLWVVGAGPITLVLLYGLVARTELASRWGSTAFLLAGWLAVMLARRRPAQTLAPGLLVAPAVGATLRTVLVLQMVCWLAAAVVAPLGAQALHRHGRAQFPGDALAALAQSTWGQRTGQPLRLLAGDIWLTGNVAARSTTLPAVLIDGELERSPWLHAADLERCGALVLLDTAPSPAMAALLARTTERGEWQLHWSDAPDAPGPRIAWGIVPPRPDTRCLL